jgi:hypothetical protein
MRIGGCSGGVRGSGSNNEIPTLFLFPLHFRLTLPRAALARKRSASMHGIGEGEVRQELQEDAALEGGAGGRRGAKRGAGVRCVRRTRI